MKALPGPLPGLWCIDIEVHDDTERPYASFREVFNEHDAEFWGLPEFEPVQWNISESTKGTIRGFHAEPWEKFIHVSFGRVFAAIVDIRPNSMTFGMSWTGILDKTKAIFVTRGLANGFQVLSDTAVYCYLVNDHWRSTDRYMSLRWDDPTIDIQWPILDKVYLSDKDKMNPTFTELIESRAFNPQRIDIQ